MEIRLLSVQSSRNLIWRVLPLVFNIFNYLSPQICSCKSVFFNKTGDNTALIPRQVHIFCMEVSILTETIKYFYCYCLSCPLCQWNELPWQSCRSDPCVLFSDTRSMLRWNATSLQPIGAVTPLYQTQFGFQTPVISISALFLWLFSHTCCSISFLETIGNDSAKFLSQSFLFWI